MTLFHGSIRKKLVMLVLLSTAPVFFVLIGTEWANRQKAVAEAQKEAAQFLSGFTEVQYRVAESTRALLKTISTIPEIRNGDIEKSRGILSTLLAANAAGSMTASGSDGLTRIVVFEPVRLEDGAPPYMYMFLGYDSTLIRAKADAILYRMAGSAAMSLTLALAIAWGVGGSSIARHMENLAQIAYRFAHGEKTSTSGID